MQWDKLNMQSIEIQTQGDFSHVEDMTEATGVANQAARTFFPSNYKP